ncbi:uncharacterized protein PHACADRAFT_191394 [Phanerochaete carnosa HHB-10118-sp]|uniref:BTB domain-containing protein n=1 Tax=Phanerochaete carnosa (strain HHB-10118-sp) TaxID=650164 RepID=K5W598_PHACS|nr:uncharacterized protein PHACADRAFT_191394 [Phanerochaete carnosa HHB-10118-sp]EKM59088.1 hypothetical protein PHACADRAFT_191394 [Phanerochaete carnosa HHB-10118-sp]
MSSGTPSELSELSISDTESFADIHDMSPTSPAPESAGPSQATETGGSVPFVDRDSPDETKHSKYYFDDGSIVVLVGKFKYRLHQYLFSRDSPYFANIFTHYMPSEPLNLADKRSSDWSGHAFTAPTTTYCADGRHDSGTLADAT